MYSLSRAVFYCLTLQMALGMPGHSKREEGECLSLEVLKQRSADADTDRLLVIERGITVLDESSDLGRELLSTQSISKSIVSLLFGLTKLRDQLPKLQDSAADFFPEWHADSRSNIRIEDLLSHRSGLCEARPDTQEIENAQDVVALARKAPICHAPGSHYQYSNSGVNLLADILRQATGKHVNELASEGLFLPLGIDDAHWSKDPAGNIYAMGGLRTTAESLAKVGQLLLAGGVLNEKRILDQAYLTQLTLPRTTFFQAYLPSYSLLWSVLHDEPSANNQPALLAYGWRGQYVFVVPHLQRVVVRLRDPFRSTTSWDCEMHSLLKDAQRPFCSAPVIAR